MYLPKIKLLKVSSKIVTITFLLISSLVLMACGSKGDRSVTTSKESAGGIAVPEQILAMSAALADSANNLKSFLTVTEKNGNSTVVSRQPMTLSADGQTVSTSITGLTEKTYVFLIEFEYNSSEFSTQTISFALASASQEISPTLGINTLAAFPAYNYVDDNGNGTTNLVELENHVDPGLCIIVSNPNPSESDSVSRINQCRLAV